MHLDVLRVGVLGNRLLVHGQVALLEPHREEVLRLEAPGEVQANHVDDDLQSLLIRLFLRTRPGLFLLGLLVLVHIRTAAGPRHLSEEGVDAGVLLDPDVGEHLTHVDIQSRPAVSTPRSRVVVQLELGPGRVEGRVVERGELRQQFVRLADIHGLSHHRHCDACPPKLDGFAHMDETESLPPDGRRGVKYSTSAHGERTQHVRVPGHVGQLQVLRNDGTHASLDCQTRHVILQTRLQSRDRQAVKRRQPLPPYVRRVRLVHGDAPGLSRKERVSAFHAPVGPRSDHPDDREALHVHLDPEQLSGAAADLLVVIVVAVVRVSTACVGATSRVW